jgi:peptidylprolyl isomerase/peptidyl-prolyl cis-trans isomerase B (cyclophilin B)
MTNPKPGYPKGLLIGIIVLVVVGLGGSLFYLKAMKDQAAEETASAPAAEPSESAATPAATAAAQATGGNPTAAPATDGKVNLDVDANGLSKSVVTIQTSKGPIKFKFYTKDAPNTVNRIVELIQKKFYDGLTFHRVVPGFVIQGGDPQGNGTGGSGQHLKAEFNDRKHVPGTVAMARASDPDSADSQFYICLGTIPHLDHNYTVFGQVVEGQDVVEKIAVGDKMTAVTIQ